MKKIMVPVLLLLGLLLISAIGASTAAAEQPNPNAKVVTPKPAGETGIIRALVRVAEIAILRSPVIWPLDGQQD